MIKTFESKIFPVTPITLAGTKEQIVIGGRDKFDLLPKAFGQDKIKIISVIGCGSQGYNQVQCIRESLEGSGIIVKIGLAKNSRSRKKAIAAGFTEANGTLGETYEVIGESDLVILLIPDAVQAEIYPKIFKAMKKGATLGLSHGFLKGHLDSIGESFPDHINIIGVCPKGMGPSVWEWYQKGRETNGAGINCSFAVEQNITGNATDIALAWATAIGAPTTFLTSLLMEYLSDLVGERGILLGGVWGAVEALFSFFTYGKFSAEEAYLNSVENITGPISKLISKKGILAVYNSLSPAGKSMFELFYSTTYGPAYRLLNEIYNEVACGNEIRSVIMAGNDLKDESGSIIADKMGKIDTTPMWGTGAFVRERREQGAYEDLKINPVTAGVYIAIMMAQADLLKKRGHRMSEICNESVIECVDSLNPYMHARGIAHMVDNCSVTARLGTRKWGPRFHHILMQQVLFVHDKGRINAELIRSFKKHKIHDALAVCGKYRPVGDISLK